MVGAKVVLADNTSGEQIPDPVTTIRSPVPAGSLRIRLPDNLQSGGVLLKALKRPWRLCRATVEFYVS
jgi:hypothetical protein